MQDLLIGMGVNVLLQVLQDPNSKAKWRRALLKVFREIARAFSTDKEFLGTAKIEFKQ
jgi:hypothetical protein